jgi:hypothetical protein
MNYIAFVLDDESRDRVLESYPPQFPDVIAHHITLVFGVPVNQDVLSGFVSGFGDCVVDVIGRVSGINIEALAVRVNGNIYRTDAKAYHITLSLDRSTGAKPADSNKLLSNYPIWNMNTSLPMRLTGRIELL